MRHHYHLSYVKCQAPWNKICYLSKFTAIKYYVDHTLRVQKSLNLPLWGCNKHVRLHHFDIISIFTEHTCQCWLSNFSKLCCKEEKKTCIMVSKVYDTQKKLCFPKLCTLKWRSVYFCTEWHTDYTCLIW
jgi:hypothetical protein